VSQDAIVRDKGAAQVNAENREGQAQRSSEPAGRELIYAARIQLAETKIQVDDRLVDLAPGMAVMAEIKIGRRRIIEYLTSPVMRYRQESLRER
jgi:hemolysin D